MGQIHRQTNPTFFVGFNFSIIKLPLYMGFSKFQHHAMHKVPENFSE